MPRGERRLKIMNYRGNHGTKRVPSENLLLIVTGGDIFPKPRSPSTYKIWLLAISNLIWSRISSMKVVGIIDTVCVCVVFPFILDARFVDVPTGVTQDFSSISLLRCLP